MSTEPTATLSALRIRDPCILPDPETETYYLCTSLHGGGPGVDVYTSRDLENWAGPFTAYEPGADSWAQGRIWAPELHRYRGRYYLFLTMNADRPLPAGAVQPEGELRANWPALVQRAVQVLVADSPRGPFRPFANRPHLPVEMMTLDGTLWVEDGAPYMVYCHEWVQLRDGTVEVVRLKEDLSGIEGETTVLFKGSDSPWVRPGQDHHVTDGPFLYRTRTGKLLMLWSSFGRQGYMTLIAASESGSVHGPWIQQPRPLFTEDGGHGMVFHRFDGAPMLVLHHPNRPPDEHALILQLEDEGDTLSIKQ